MKVLLLALSLHKPGHSPDYPKLQCLLLLPLIRFEHFSFVKKNQKAFPFHKILQFIRGVNSVILHCSPRETFLLMFWSHDCCVSRCSLLAAWWWIWLFCWFLTCSVRLPCRLRHGLRGIISFFLIDHILSLKLQTQHKIKLTIHFFQDIPEG